MSVLSSYAVNYINQCTKECGIITTTQDCTYFALNCVFCREKFYYFDAFIAHIQTDHGMQSGPSDDFSNPYIDSSNDKIFESEVAIKDNMELAVVHPTSDSSILDIKEEIPDESSFELNNQFTSDFQMGEEFNDDDLLLPVKQEPVVEIETEDEQFNFLDESPPELVENSTTDIYNDDKEHYDDLVEESLLCNNEKPKLNGDNQPHMHIKDRKMISYLISAYRRNSFLWDYRNSQFRDRVKRQQFLDWIINEFKLKFNIVLARDAISRKWDNLRTVYKREITRMSQEKTKISTLWYFKELRFLNKLYCNANQLSDTIVNETIYRRRYSAVWNDQSTLRLLEMVRNNPCFYDKFHPDYRSKEKRGEALHKMVAALHNYVEVNTIQISKRISQLRFDYSKQKHERLLCEVHNKSFAPSYSYYNAMKFMDHDIAPFKCEQCPSILQTVREREFHALQHQPSDGVLTCEICGAFFDEKEKYIMHKQVHWPPMKESKFYNCELCTAAFTDRLSYEEHVSRHNDDLLLPDLSDVVTPIADESTHHRTQNENGSAIDKPYTCECCFSTYVSHSELLAHCKTEHENKFKYKCDFPNCNKEFVARQSLTEHTRQHYSGEEYKCDICAKIFRSAKNLSNHRQIHDAIKRYVCKICGSAFAQAAGLYLHKRRHNRPNGRLRISLEDH